MASSGHASRLKLIQSADAVDAQVRGWVGGLDLWIESVVSLPHEDSSHPQAPMFFDLGKDAQFVVHNYIMNRRIPGFHVGQLMLFMHVNQRVSIDGLIKS